MKLLTLVSYLEVNFVHLFEPILTSHISHCLTGELKLASSSFGEEYVIFFFILYPHNGYLTNDQ